MELISFYQHRVKRRYSLTLNRGQAQTNQAVRGLHILVPILAALDSHFPKHILVLINNQ